MTVSRPLMRVLADIYTVSVLCVMTEAFLSFLVDPDDLNQTNSGSPITKSIWALVYVISLVRIILYRREAAHRMKGNWPLLVLVVLAMLSVSWSLDASLSLRTAVTLLFSALFALDISIRYSVQKQLKLLLIALCVLMALSVLCEVLLPGIVPGGNLDAPSAWHGVFGRKNELGRMACLTAIVGITAIQHSRTLRVLIAIVGFAIALLSQSITAAVYVIFTLLVVESFPLFHWRPKPRLVGLVLVLVLVPTIAAFTYENRDQLSGLVGKDSGLTGRVDLWRLSATEIMDRPVLGYGFQAFWDQDSERAMRIREEVNWEITPHSHNGYIDLTLSLGLVGLLVSISLYVALFRRSLKYILQGQERFRRWPLALLIFVLIYQFTETTIIAGNTILWCLLCALAFSVPTSCEQESLAVIGRFSLIPAIRR